MHEMRECSMVLAVVITKPARKNARRPVTGTWCDRMVHVLVCGMWISSNTSISVLLMDMMDGGSQQYVPAAGRRIIGGWNKHKRDMNGCC
jgi:hypothetical protein